MSGMMQKRITESWELSLEQLENAARPKGENVSL
jgi:hypothetical protein